MLKIKKKKEPLFRRGEIDGHFFQRNIIGVDGQVLSGAKRR